MPPPTDSLGKAPSGEKVEPRLKRMSPKRARRRGYKGAEDPRRRESVWLVLVVVIVFVHLVRSSSRVDPGRSERRAESRHRRATLAVLAGGMVSLERSIVRQRRRRRKKMTTTTKTSQTDSPCEDPLLLYILSGVLAQATFVSGVAQPFPHLVLCQANRWVGA